MVRELIQPADYTYEQAPDGSILALLARSTAASLCKGSLPPGSVSRPVAHKTVEELWLISGGSGEFFCLSINAGRVFSANTGTSFVIPPRTPFQFRTSGDVPLEFVIATIPAWPGDEEIMQSTQGVWAATIVNA